MSYATLSPPNKLTSNGWSMSKILHILTVHWRSSQWVEIQLGHIKRHCPLPVKTYAYLNGVDPVYHQRFDLVRTEDDLSHAEKLNSLAERVLETAAESDYLLFIDGDAFPVADISPVLAQLQQYPLIAVKRFENFGDQQPHPCFCVTTVGLWREIKGDWNSGGFWLNSAGRQVTDVGGLLLENLQRRSLNWQPLLRSNRRDLHPLMFGIYGDIVYHHGAGFRDKLCRRDVEFGIDRFSSGVLKWRKSLRLGRRLPSLNEWLVNGIKAYMRWRNSRLDQKVFKEIDRSENFLQSLGLK